MGTQTVRVSRRTHEEVRELSRQLNVSMQSIIEEAVELYRRKKFFEQSNAAYSALRNDPGAWEDEQAERALWEGTSADGLSPEDVWVENQEVNHP